MILQLMRPPEDPDRKRFQLYLNLIRQMYKESIC